MISRFGSFLNPVSKLLASRPLIQNSNFKIQSNFLQTSACLERHSFYNQRTAQVLWKTNTSVSTQGRARGRARGVMRIRNLNRGQKLGFGKARISWPGLTEGILDKNRKKAEMRPLTEKEYKNYEDGVQAIRAMSGMGRSRKKKQTALERGWAGNNPQGKLYGSPDPLNDSMSYDDFESILIEHKLVSHQTGKYGRVRMISMLMLTGNKQGLAGFALTKVPTGRGPGTFQKAVNKAGLRLCHIDLYEGRTVYHDIFTQFGSTKIFIRQKPPGFGIQAHRTIKAACKIIGIQDLECVIEGAVNYNHIIKAFFLGLLRQRTHQDLADEKKLHLVELRAENDYFPRLLASPSDGTVRTKEEIDPNESLDFELIALEGHLPYIKPEAAPFWEREPGWQIYLKKEAKRGHMKEQRIQMLADYGEVKSHLVDRYPECDPMFVQNNQKKKSEQNEE